MKHEYKLCKIYQSNGNWRRHNAWVVGRNENIEDLLEDFIMFAILKRPALVNNKDAAKAIVNALKMMTIVHRSSKYSDYNKPGYEEHRFKYYNKDKLMKAAEQILANLQLSSISCIDAL